MTTNCSVVLAATAFALALLASPSRAQRVAGTPFVKADINGDGYLDAVELMALFDVAGLNLLSQNRNGDGLLSRRELRAGQAEAEEWGTQRAGIDNRGSGGPERASRGSPDHSNAAAISQAEELGTVPRAEPVRGVDTRGACPSRPGGLERADPNPRSETTAANDPVGRNLSLERHAFEPGVSRGLSRDEGVTGQSIAPEAGPETARVSHGRDTEAGDGGMAAGLGRDDDAWVSEGNRGASRRGEEEANGRERRENKPRP